MSLRTRLILAFLLAAVVRLEFHLATGFVADDAFITFRYAENLAQGYGFVYNAGERVLGSSSPLFAWILAVLISLKIPTLYAALGLSLVCSGLTSAILYRMATYLRFGSLAWLPVVAYSFWPRSVPAEMSGLETALFSLLVIATFYCTYRKLHFYAIGCATLATLTRPEGVLLLILILGVAVYRQREHWLSLMATTGLLLIPWLIFSQLYFGSVVPHSIPAKLALYSRFGSLPWWQNLATVMAWHNFNGWVLTLLVLVGGWWLYKKQNYGRIEFVWLLGMILFFTFSRTHLFFWYPAPLYPVILLLATAAMPFVLEVLSPRIERRPKWSHLLIVGCAVVVVAGMIKPLFHYREEQRYAEEVLKSAGAFLAENVDRKSEIVAAEDIGYLGYYSGCRILDRDGLMSPSVVPYNARGDYLGLILNRRPDWVGVTSGSPISAFVTDSVFLEVYRLEQQFELDSVPRYEIFTRK